MRDKNILGYRKDGRPIRMIRGGSTPPEPDGNTITVPVPPPAPVVEPNPVPPVQTFTAEDVARIRKEEKDKLYGKVSSLEEQIKTLADEAKARKDDADAKAAQKAADAKAKFEEEASAKELLSTKEKEWNAKFEELNNKAELERVLREKERELAALQQYIQQRVNEESDKIAPELLRFVTGNNKDEVESSLASVIESSQAIAETVAANLPQAQPVPNLRGVSVTGNAPAGGPMDGGQHTKTYTAADIAAMQVGSPEYLALRKSMGIGQGGQGQGLFG